jgi:hypothetical protein
MRTAAGWSDACILNVSSRGALIHSKRPITEGSAIELRHGDQVIFGRIVWHEGAKAGVQSDHRIPVEHILSLADAPALMLAAPVRGDRRRRPRTHEQSRQQSRLMEFAGVVIITVAFSSAAFALVGEAFARPLAQVRDALGTQAASASSR